MQFNQIYNFPNFGKSQIKITVYSLKNKLLPLKQKVIKLEISRQMKRSQKYKFMIFMDEIINFLKEMYKSKLVDQQKQINQLNKDDQQDIIYNLTKEYLKIIYDKNIFNQQEIKIDENYQKEQNTLTKINSKFDEQDPSWLMQVLQICFYPQIVIENQSIYKKIVIPFKNEQYVLDLSNNNKLLEKQTKHKKTLYHGVQRINGQFFIITLQFIFFNQNWQILLYSPQSKRILKFSLTFYELITHNSKMNYSKDQKHFFNKNQYLKNFQIFSFQYQQFPDQQEITNELFLKIMMKFIHRQEQLYYKFLGLQLIQSMVSDIEINLKNEKLIVQTNNQKQFLREHIFSDTLKVQGLNIYFEFFLNSHRISTQISDKIETLWYFIAQSYYFFVRMTLWDIDIIYNYKFNLRQVFVHYLESKLQYLECDDSLKQFEFKQSALKSVCQFMIQRIKSVESFHIQKGLDLSLITTKNEQYGFQKMQIHRKIDKQSVKNQNEQNINKKLRYEYFQLLHKSVVKSFPKTFLSIFYESTKRKIYFKIQNLKTFRTYDFKIKVDVIKTQFINIDFLLQQSLYQEVGLQIQIMYTDKIQNKIS